MLGEVGVVVAGIVGDILTEESGSFEGSILRRELDFSKDKSLIITVEHIHFHHQAIGNGDDIAVFLDSAGKALGKESVEVGHIERFLPFEMGDASRWCGSFDREISAIVGTADTNRAAGMDSQIALADMLAAGGQLFERVAVNKKFMFYFLIHYSSVNLN